jgi:hypothetical protein
VEPVVWFSIVFLVFLKIPVLYVCYVVWWAVKDPPAPGEGFGTADGGEPEEGGPEPGSWWLARHRRRPPLRRGPHGTPTRRPEPVLTPSTSVKSKPHA